MKANKRHYLNGPAGEAELNAANGNLRGLNSMTRKIPWKIKLTKWTIFLLLAKI